jgi:hypothetical protein
LREECRQDLVQQEPEPADHAAKVVVGRGEDGVGGVAATEPEVVAIHAVLGFEMADNGFDGGPAAQFALDVGRHPRFWPKMKTLKGLTPYEFICKYWTSEPDRPKPTVSNRPMLLKKSVLKSPTAADSVFADRAEPKRVGQVLT